jgi:Fe-S-cluster-containing hydrogenase component 2
VICKQGEAADAFYLIRLGFVKVSQDYPGGEMVLTYLSRGSYFGEIGLLPPVFLLRARGDKPGESAQATVGGDTLIAGRGAAAEPGHRLEIPWDEYISREHFEAKAEGKQVRVTRLGSGKNPITYRMQPMESFLLSPGESFIAGNTTFEVAEDPFLSGRRTATCSAMDFVQLVRIRAEDFGGMLARFPEVGQRIQEVARSRRKMDEQILNRVSTISLNEFLEQELMQAQNLLLLDLEKCTRCDDCVRACAATHDDGITRLVREGLRFDKYLVPTSCRACMDPLCMTRCPVGAIRRKESLDIVIEDWCIGCSACAEECPYGNINIVDTSLLPGAPAQSHEDAKPKAVVCDLCQEYDEPNCVRACPQDAALRVEPKSFFARELAGVQLRVAVAHRPAASVTAAGALPAAAIETRIHSNVADLLDMLPRLRLRNGERAGSTLQLRFPETSFGRTAECDYRFGEESGVSKVHCVIRADGARFTIADRQSTNGTLVNGNAVTEMELRHGDVILIGEIEMEFLMGQGK